MRTILNSSATLPHADAAVGASYFASGQSIRTRQQVRSTWRTLHQMIGLSCIYLHQGALLLLSVQFRLDRFAAAFEGVQPGTASCQSVRLSFANATVVRRELQPFQLDQRKGFCLQGLGQSESRAPRSRWGLGINLLEYNIHSEVSSTTLPSSSSE